MLTGSGLFIEPLSVRLGALGSEEVFNVASTQRNGYVAVRHKLVCCPLSPNGATKNATFLSNRLLQLTLCRPPESNRTNSGSVSGRLGSIPSPEDKGLHK